VLQVQPVSRELLARLKRYLPEHAGELIGIASRWTDFQRIARTLLVAAGLQPESLLVRDATQAGWKRGLDATSGVVCDALTAEELPAGVFPLRFTLLDEPTLAELRRSEQPLTWPRPDGCPD
jgi:GntR family transcriptional regulator